MLKKLTIFREKRFFIHKIFTFSFLLLLSKPCFLVAQPQFTATLSETQASIGDTITATLQATANATTQIFFPTIAPYPLPNDSSLEVLKSYPLQKKILQNQARTTYTQKFVFTAYDSALYTFPAFVFKYLNNNNADTATFVPADSLKILFTTPKIDTNAPIKDISPIIDAQPSYWQTYLKWFLIALANLYLAYRIYKKLKKQPKPQTTTTPIPTLSAYEQAMADLKNLDKQQLWQKNEIELYYTKLTDILRTYLQNQYNIKATTLTSKHTISLLKKAVPSHQYTTPLEPLLNTADLVKFAQMHPQHEIHAQMMTHVLNFVEYEKKQNPTNTLTSA